MELGFDRKQIGINLIFASIEQEYVLSILDKIAKKRITGTQSYGPWMVAIFDLKKKNINSGQTINIFNILEEQNLLSSKKYIYMVNLKSMH